VRISHEEKMILEWTLDLSVGYEMIDHQHRELFARTSRLFEAMRNGNASTEIASTVEFLESYVVEHFNDEQDLMRNNQYPEYPAHCALHDEFVTSLQGFKDELQTDSLDKVAAQIMLHLGQWLLSHVAGADKELGNYLKSRCALGTLVESTAWISAT